MPLSFADCGGLVGYNDYKIIASYATGHNVSALGRTANAGGLVGYGVGLSEPQMIGSEMTACYATVGNIDATGVHSLRGALLGGVDPSATNVSISDCFFDSETSSVAQAVGDPAVSCTDCARTTSELQSPVDYSGIYQNWNIDIEDPWNFVGSNRYPKLRVDLNEDGVFEANEFGGQLLILTNVGGDELSRTSFSIIEGASSATNVGTIMAVNASTGNSPSLQLVSNSQEFELSGNDVLVKAGAVLSFAAIRLHTLAIQLTDADTMAVRHVDINIQPLADLVVDLDDNDNGLIDVKNIDQLNAMRFDLDGDGQLSDKLSLEEAQAYEEAFDLPRRGSGSCTGGCGGYELSGPLDFTDPNSYKGGTVADTLTEAGGAAGWLPIGLAPTFNTTFEGNGHTISNIYINRPNATDVGLFGALGSEAEVRNVGIVGGSVTGATYVAPLVGINSSGMIKECYATANATATVRTEISFAAGLVGGNRGVVVGSYATGNASAIGYVSFAAGLVADNLKGAVISSYATGNSTSVSIDDGNAYAGGLVAYNDGAKIISSYATGNSDVNTSGARAAICGGLVGINVESSITACYAAGNASTSVNSSGGAAAVGGLVGVNAGRVAACYAKGVASGLGDFTSRLDVGGLIGVNTAISFLFGVEVSSSYSTASVAAENSGRGATYIGGLIGGVDSETVSNSYFNSDLVRFKGIGNREGNDVLPEEEIVKITSDLLTPTDYSGIYASWNVDVDEGASVGAQDGTMPGDDDADSPWDFGTDSEYPALKVDFERDGDATVEEFGDQSRNEPIVITLEISNISPTSGPVGTKVKIAGTGFSVIPKWNSISFGGSDFVAADEFIRDKRTSVSSSVDTLVVDAPSDAQTGKISVKARDGMPAMSTVDFIVEAPVVSSFTPTSGAVGTTVTITGTDFSTTAGDNTVTFLGNIDADADNAEATVSAATATLLTVTVPPDAQTGKISVMVGTAADTSAASFTVAVLTVDVFTPTSGAVGTTVTITGTDFSTTAGDNTVTFLGNIDADADNAEATVSAATATLLTVTVPPDAQTGKISVMVGTAADTSAASFTVAVLTVGGFTPTSGAVNTEVKIWGTGFSSTVTEDSISFGGSPYVVASSFIADTRSGASLSIDTLKVSVPSDVQTGTIRVKALDGQPATSSGTFTVITTFSVPTEGGGLRVYPNPTSGLVQVVSSSFTGTYVYKVYSMVGQEVSSGTIRGNTLIDLSSLLDGKYVLVVQRAKRKEILRIRLIVSR